jgi:anti-sigma factor ChrR (cupin superfamily)
MELINEDLARRVVLDSDAMQWTASPQPGVDRKVLESLDPKTERVTTIVRFAPDSYFPEHGHDGGEEFIVLEGVFSDEDGDYPAGSYVRNPPGSSHKPFTREGCTILVKLWQFGEDDLAAVRIDTNSVQWYPGLVDGLSVLPLHEHDGVNTALVSWDPHTRFNPHSHPGGEEILVLKGMFCDEFGEYRKGTWIRNPRDSRHRPFTGEEGALIYVRVGQLGAVLIGQD